MTASQASITDVFETMITLVGAKEKGRKEGERIGGEKRKRKREGWERV